MHEHLYILKRKKKVNLLDGNFCFTATYICDCEDWIRRKIKPEQKIPKIWIWEIFSDRPVKMRQII